MNICFINAEEIEKNGTGVLGTMDGILVPGGFGTRGINGKMLAIQYARENGIPFFGICLGMQLAVIEYARHIAGLTGAHSSEFDPQTAHPVIALINEWITPEGKIEMRTADSDLGGTMRLGAQPCKLAEHTRARAIYKREVIQERHRHRYEFNNQYADVLEKAGLVLSGRSLDDSLVEMIELKDHPWFIACQFHPEFASTLHTGQPLFISFVSAAGIYAESRKV